MQGGLDLLRFVQNLVAFWYGGLVHQAKVE